MGLTWGNGRARASVGSAAFTVVPRRSPLVLVRLWCEGPSFDGLGRREVDPYPRLPVPVAHLAYDQVDGCPHWRQLLHESLHSRLASAANRVQ